MSFYRTLIFLIPTLCFFPGIAAAQWVPDGVKLCPSGCGADAPQITTDQQGGAFIAWRDGRFANNDIALQKVTGSGSISPGWPVEGLSICTDPSAQHLNRVAPDGSGGVFVVWEDFRNALTLGTGLDIYLQRVTASGAIHPGWPANGVPVCRARRHQGFPEIVHDGQGGVFVAWDDPRSDNYDIYLQRLLGDGNIAPGWPENGAPVCTLATHQTRPSIVADGLGGAFLFWSDTRSGTSDLYGIRVLSDGSVAPGWAAQGSAIATGPSTMGVSSAVADGAGGAYVAWVDYVDIDFGPSDVYAQRITANGSPAPGWPVGGIAVAPAPDIQDQQVIAPDGFGGLLLAWTDFRNYLTHGADIYAQRLMPDGTVAPGWPAAGARVGERMGWDEVPHIAPDGLGGAYVVYEGLSSLTQTFVQHLSASGERLWLPNGVLASNGPQSQFTPKVTADGAHGAIVAWDGPEGSIWAQRFVGDGPVAIALALVHAEATPDRVVLLWHGPGAGALRAGVERRGESSDWRPVGEAVAEGGDRLRFEDASVDAGERYAYRLVYVDQGLTRTTPEAWVDVPAAFELALHGFRPNPARGAVAVAFTLPDNAPASLEVLDIAGRRVARHDVGALGVGRHLLRLSDAGLAPGVYVIRLLHGENDTVVRGVVTR